MNDNKPIDEQIEINEEVIKSEVQNIKVKQASGFNLEFLRAETGEGEISDYIGHPLNFNKSESVARILRGLTGLFGNLRLAVIDIAVGLMEFARDRKNVQA